MQVIYHAGMNEKLIGDFFRKHDLRDKVFSEYQFITARSKDQKTDKINSRFEVRIQYFQ